MITFGLIMCNILSECPAKRCLTKENHATQAFVFYRTHKPFCKSVTVGGQAGDVDGIALCRLFNTAISTQGVPHYISSDNDPLFRYYRWQANLRILDVTEIKSVPYVPLSHPFVEQLIGTIRRDAYHDHALFWNAGDLERKLEEYRHSYNAHRVHTSLDGKASHYRKRDESDFDIQIA